MLLSFLMMPVFGVQSKRYFEGQAIAAYLSLSAALVWLAAPIAVWDAFGLVWSLFWLVPTCAAVCAMGLSRARPAGG